MKHIIAGFLLFFLGQLLIWFQTNSQFLSQWCKEHPGILALCGIPISYILILATTQVVQGFDGSLWPGRLLGFASGMIVMTICTWWFMGEGITTKTIISLLLSGVLVLIQIFWR
tara:strand:- start:5108 stop:5449 length:342 start_codon:yes stop_codon:yes gene_type:complete